MTGSRRRAILLAALAALGTVIGLLGAEATPATALTRPANPDLTAPAISRTYCGYDIWAVSTIPGRGFSSCMGLRRTNRASGGPLTLAGHQHPGPGASEASHSANWSGYVVHNATYNDI